ncbi:thiamine pyrophosphate-binding protein [Calderihabitans maritimus]|uniref:Acetolactate synthase, large subunit, biosynthetic type n=1 Tax=Calderihabitans maritimus TaxID=1246530 RepID=A0A1Z5HTX2_9FIRM|nr:thiamine pyrophosphate-binding protein [Calderihabitans maritimus]GAW92974.1 acetolactate synthase, large subunit, biosynthetic type [Calderihabitans maritimus]
MVRLGIEFDEEAQKKLDIPLGQRELYPSVGKYIAEILREQGVNIAFGVPGGHIWHFIDAISRIGIKTITFAHEQNAVYAGEAYSQVTQKPAVCYGTVGPGTGNSFSAMQQAWLSNTPIIYLAGGIEVEHDGLFNTIQESYAHRFFEHVTKWSPRVIYPWQVKQFLTRGFKIAQAAPRAPVAFELGIDLLFSKDDEMRQHYWGGFFQKHSDYVEKWRGEDTPKPLTSAANPEAVAKAAKAIVEAKRPFLIIGDQAAWDQAGPEMEEFVNLMKIPFTTRRLGRAVISEKHKNYHRGFPPFRKDIDLMISAGLKVGFFDGYGRGWPQTIQISNCQEQVWTYIKTLEVLLGNLKAVFKQLNDYIKANNLQAQLSPERDEWLRKCQESHAQAVSKRRDKAYKYGPDHPRYREKDILHYGYMSQIIREVNDELYGSKTRVMIDGYTMSDFVMPYLEFTRPASCITANDQAGVGHGVGQAIGAAFGDMEKGELLPILALMGDSGMMNAGWDVEVAVRHKLPIVYLVTNNGGWMPGMKYIWYGPNWDVLGDQDVYGNIWQGHKQMGEERPIDIQFEKFAESIGAYGMVCNRSEKFREDLKKAYSIAEKGQPVVMNCIMDQHLVNRATMGPAYCLMYAHIPYHELPYRGKAARKRFLSQWFEGLKNEPDMAFPDSWEPLTEEEFGYEPKEEFFK